jgi:hypothetical protein
VPAATASGLAEEHNGCDPQGPSVLSTCPEAASDYRPAPRCRSCGRRIPPPLQRCRRRTCPSYAPLWAGDQRQKLFANLNAYADQVPSGISSPRVLVSAAIAPGVEGGMHWDEHGCRAPGEHEHSGKIGCRVRSSDAARWNETTARPTNVVVVKACGRGSSSVSGSCKSAASCTPILCSPIRHWPRSGALIATSNT